MSYCLNPNCPQPQNPSEAKLCRSCRAKLLLRGRYRAIQPIGQGGFGRTFLAIDEDKPLKPLCVIKQFFYLENYRIPSASHQNSKKAAQLFEQEALRLDQLGKHPQIPELLAYTIQEHRQYVVQEYIDGINLAELVVKEGVFNESQIRDLLERLLPLLHFIHSHHIIHRDIKPENIISTSKSSRFTSEKIDANQLVLVDFGAAKFSTGTALLKTGTTIGSPEYIAPEQARGKAYFSSDLYSLGVTCLHLLTQISPFDLFDPGENQWVWRYYLINNPVSDKFGEILDKMVQIALNRRYQSAREVLQDLNPQLVLQLPSFEPVNPPQNFQKNIENLPHSNLSKISHCQCFQTLTQHSSIIYTLDFSPNGEILSSGGSDHLIKLWRVAEGEEIVTLIGHNQPIYSVTFDPTGEILASGSEDKTIKLWRMKDGKNIITLTGHHYGIYSVAFSPNGEILASSSWDKTIKFWRIKNGEEMITLKGHQGLIHSVIFSPNGEILASSSWDKTIKLWRSSDGQLMKTLTGHKGAVKSLAFSPDGEFLASGSHDHTIKIWWVKNGQEILTFKGHSGYVDCLKFSPDGQMIVSGSKEILKLWSVKDGQEIFTLPEHTNSIYSLAWSPEANIFASGSSDKTIKLWTIEP